MTERFNVVLFSFDGLSDYVRRDVSDEEAVKAAKRYSESVAARLGLTKRIIITDSGDYTVFEWKHGEGVTYPPPQQKEATP
jgi:hypothetical protein